VCLEYHLKNCKNPCEGLETAQNYNNAAISLIFSGAIGNIIASVFYGVIFDSLNHKVATLFAETSYGDLFYGKVVDVIYFLLWQGTLPEWIPFFGGDFFTFFNIYLILQMLLFLLVWGCYLFLANKRFQKKRNSRSKNIRSFILLPALKNKELQSIKIEIRRSQKR
jgi:lipoprotein signal peptidase